MGRRSCRPSPTASSSAGRDKGTTGIHPDGGTNNQLWCRLSSLLCWPLRAESLHHNEPLPSRPHRFLHDLCCHRLPPLLEHKVLLRRVHVDADRVSLDKLAVKDALGQRV